MPITKYNYPASFRMLRPDLLIKAIEIGNLLLKAGYKDEIAEIIAFSNAKIWPSYFSISINATSEIKLNVHLIPHPEGWALISGDAKYFYFVCPIKNEALARARAFAKNKKLKLFIHSQLGNICDTESFVVNKPSVNNIPQPINDTTKKEMPVFALNKRESIRGAAWIVKSRSELVSNKGDQMEAA